MLGVVWFLNDGTVERRSLALVKDYLGNVEYAIHVFLHCVELALGTPVFQYDIHFISEALRPFYVVEAMELDTQTC